MIECYLTDRIVIFEGDQGKLVHQISSDVLLVSKIGPKVNVLYDDFLRMDLPENASIVMIADHAIIVSTTDTPEKLKVVVNCSLERTRIRLAIRRLEMTKLWPPYNESSAKGSWNRQRNNSVNTKYWETKRIHEKTTGQRSVRENAIRRNNLGQCDEI